MAMWALHAVQTPHIGAIIFPLCSEAGKHCPYIGETLQHLCVPRKEIYELVKCICFRFIFETVRLFIFNYFSNLQVPENFDRQELLIFRLFKVLKSGCLFFCSWSRQNRCGGAVVALDSGGFQTHNFRPNIHTTATQMGKHGHFEQYLCLYLKQLFLQEYFY